MKIPTQTFVTIWQGSSSVAEVALRTGYKARYASQRAARLRASGLDLKRFTGGGVCLDDVVVPTPEDARAGLDALGELRSLPADQVAELPHATRRPVALEDDEGEEGW